MPSPAHASTLSVEEAAEYAGGLVRELATDAFIARVNAAEQYANLASLLEFSEIATGASWCDPDDLAWRDLRAEVAAALEIHENTAGERLDMARRLVHDFPDTHARL